MVEVDAKPFAFRFDPARTALVVIDMQRDFLEPGGFGETDKPGKGMFRAINVAQILKERDVASLVFAGVTTEVCVQASMHEANDRGYECLLIEDATASYFPAFKAATLDMIRAQGAIVGWTAPFPPSGRRSDDGRALRSRGARARDGVVSAPVAGFA